MAEVTQTKVTGMPELDIVQGEIETYTKKIEQEKINLRLTKERYEKQFSQYLQLQGMPDPFKSKEEREKEKKKKHEEKKKRKPLYETNKNSNKLEVILQNPISLNKEVGKEEITLDKVEYLLNFIYYQFTNDINQLLLENKDLRKQTEDLRKEKLVAKNMLENLKNKHEQIKIEIDYIEKINEEARNRIRVDQLDETKKDNVFDKKDFELNRENLEEKYHKIIEENVKRERDHKKELSRKRNLLGSMTGVKEDLSKSGNLTSEQFKMLEDEDISDRTPILDILIEKWKYYNKYKKVMLERYSKNSVSIKDAFDKIMRFLGLDEYDDLPIVLEKMEEQMSSIQIYISELTNQIDQLEDKKRLIEQKIQLLSKKLKHNADGKTNFQESKLSNIARLKNHIAELKEDINKKRQFFIKIQPITDSFMNKMDSSYLNDYIPNKIAVNPEIPYNESNVTEVLANVEDYQKIIQEFDKTSFYPDKNMDILVNKEIDKLKLEMRAKIEKVEKEKLSNYNYHGIRNDSKPNSSFDETIKKMAEEVIKIVNLTTSQKEIPMKKKRKSEFPIS